VQRSASCACKSACICERANAEQAPDGRANGPVRTSLAPSIAHPLPGCSLLCLLDGQPSLRGPDSTSTAGPWPCLLLYSVPRRQRTSALPKEWIATASPFWLRPRGEAGTHEHGPLERGHGAEEEEGSVQLVVRGSVREARRSERVCGIAGALASCWRSAHLHFQMRSHPRWKLCVCTADWKPQKKQQRSMALTSGGAADG
jgi:hypothetical protein